MIQTGIKFKTVVDYLKDHMSVILIVPAFIGGLWQVLELMNISYSYIRFFSISQIVPDGILILMFGLIGSFIFLLTFLADTLFFDKRDLFVEYLNDDEYQIRKKKEFRKWIIIFTVLYIFTAIYFVKVMFDVPDISQFRGDVGFAFLLIFWLNISLSKCYYFTKDNWKEAVKACNILLLIIYFIIALNFSIRIHRIFLQPSNNLNIQGYKKEMKEKFPNTKQELLYFNDKYMFIRIIDKSNKEKVYVTKLDNLFD